MLLSQIDSNLNLIQANQSDLSEINLDVANIELSINSLQSTVNALAAASGVNSFAGLDQNRILQISNDDISTYDDFYINDSNHYVLLSHQSQMSVIQLSDDLIVENNTLKVNSSLFNDTTELLVLPLMSFR